MTYFETLQLTDGSTTLNFSPAQGYDKPDEMSKLTSRANDGSLYIYKRFIKRSWNIPLRLIDKTTSDQIYTWFSALTLLSFYPDMVNTPSTYYSVRILNEARPLNTMSEWTWEVLYDGNLLLGEV